MPNSANRKSEAGRTIRILHIEDCLNDRVLIAHALQAEGLDCETTYVTTEKEFRMVLAGQTYDLILSDFTLPAFSGAAALALAKALQPDIPFLFVSGTIGMERAIESLKEGATDYVLKGNLERLGPSVYRALREVRERKERLRAEQRIRQLNRTYAVLSNINQLIVREREPQVILNGACTIAVEQGGFRMAWVGLLDATGRIMNPAAYAGTVDGYLETVNLESPDAARNTEPSARAMRSGEHQVCNHIENDPDAAPWRKAALERGYRACAAFPLKIDGKPIGTFNLYASEPCLFDTEELCLLDELALDIAFALEGCERKQERQRALEQLGASEERFRELAETIQEVFWITDPAKQRMLYISPAYESIWGRSCQSLYDQPSSWLDAIHPEDRERVRRAAATRQVEGNYDEEYRVIRPDLQIRWIRDTAFPVRNGAGEVERMVGVARDVTERRLLAEQLRQSQKMEALGQLAGGVAHDFNNILAAIMMQAHLSATTENVPEDVRDGLLQIRSAAERAATLIRQLLLFSSKQVMQARNLDLNEVVTSLAKMLQRIIGEDVRTQLHLHPQPLLIHADSGMLDQVLVNLAVNARDAMPAGGRLLIETTARTVGEHFTHLHPGAVPGDYVCLSVSDNGTGIPPEVLSRIFEPFFTTKEPGKGTGLGLATVFGIVKQHGGFIEVESEPGQGAKFLIFLPASRAVPKSSAREARPKLRRGTETILLVEDDEAVRFFTHMLLKRHGYKVLEATNGVHALKLWEEHREEVALVLTDLVMPAGVSGQELAGRLQRDKPELRVILASGYSAEIAGRQAKFQPGQNFLQKPFPPDQLVEMIGQCLDGL